jgi:hypothetical protein
MYLTERQQILKIIKRLVEVTDMIWMGSVNKLEGMLVINYLYKSTMQEGILHIELMH